MEDSALVNNNVRPKIATLVFMDLESTGLPCHIGKKNVQITEMSLIAVDRKSFEIDRNLRVLNKINLCVRPRSVISPISMDITGLYNDILESQQEFDDSVPKMLEYFFRRLQKPICLLAHNGNKFDFPILQAELNRINYSLGSDVVCADTLEAFRYICNSKKQVEALEADRKATGKKNAPERQKSCVGIPISDEDIDSILLDDLESFTNIDNVLISQDSDIVKPVATETASSENPIVQETTIEDSSVSVINPVKANEFISLTLDMQTPQKNKIPINVDGNINPAPVRKRRILDPTYTPQSDYKKRTKPVERNMPAKRILFNEYDLSSFEIHKITKFSLQNLYNHFFHANPPNSHYAEVDTISLSKVCQKINKDFLHWIDDNYVPFPTINALW